MYLYEMGRIIHLGDGWLKSREIRNFCYSELSIQLSECARMWSDVPSPRNGWNVPPCFQTKLFGSSHFPAISGRGGGGEGGGGGEIMVVKSCRQDEWEQILVQLSPIISPKQGIRHGVTKSSDDHK